MKLIRASRQACVSLALFGLSLSAGPSFGETYDFVWFSGADKPWVHEAGAKLLVEVTADATTPENDVLIRVRNVIDTELGYSSSISDLQIDTGSTTPAMFTSVTLIEQSAGNLYSMYTPGNPQTLLDLAAARVLLTGEYAAGRPGFSAKTAGVNPGEFATFRAVLADGMTFAHVINAMDVGISSAYVPGSYSTWTTAQKQFYRAEATKGLRLALLVHSIVPNTWNPDGHGLFVTHSKVAAVSPETPTITQLSATPSTLLDTQTSQLLVAANDPEPGPSPLSYQWTIVSGGGSLDDAGSPAPVYTPADVSATETVELRVDISDGANTVSGTLTLQVNDADAPPPNVPPQINGLSASPESLLDDATSQLTVTASDTDNGPAPLSYQWTILNGGGVLDDANSPTPVYTPADVTGTQAVSVRVDVSDGEATVSSTLNLQVSDANPPPPGLYLLDTDFSANSLADWSVYDEGTISAPSKWRALSGAVVHQSNINDASSATALPKLGTFLLYDDGQGWTDYRARFTLRSDDDDVLGLMFRVTDAKNYYRFSWDKQRNSRRLVKNVNGAFTQLAADNVPYVAGRTYEVEIVAIGSQLEVWIDGARIFQVSDTSHSRGSVAFYSWMNNAGYYDDLSVEYLGSGPLNALPKITALSATPASILDNATSQLAVVVVDPDGPATPSYQWSIVNGGGTLDDATSATPVYTPADIAGTQSVTLRVEVSDGEATVIGNLTLQVTDANPPPLGPELLAADFADGSLSGWSVRDEGTISAPSKWRVVAGEVVQQSNIRDGSTANSVPKLGTYLQHDAGTDWSDYRAKFTLRSSDDDTLGVMFRVADADNYYRFSWDKQLNQRRLVKKVGGVFSVLAADNVPYVMGQNYVVEIVAAGTQLEVWVDGARIFQVSDASVTQGSIAFYCWQNNGVAFDNVQINAIE